MATDRTRTPEQRALGDVHEGVVHGLMLMVAWPIFYGVIVGLIKWSRWMVGTP